MNDTTIDVPGTPPDEHASPILLRRKRADIDSLYELVEQVDQKVDASDLTFSRD
jgi:hypothetical protein